MKNSILYISLLTIILISCGTPKQAINYRDLATTANSQGAYEKVISNLNKYIENQELNALETDPQVYSELAEAYWNLGNKSEAERYYDWAMTKNAVSENLNLTMAEYYKEIDNLSREITALEYYRDHHPSGKDSVLMRNRLFETYIKSENWQLASDSWQVLDEESKQREPFLQKYFELNKQLEQKEKCDQLASDLLSLNPDNPSALEWMAKKYYDLGENRYQSAMNAYNKKKTTKNYNILLKELDQVTLDLKKSLTYFDKLWKMEGGKKYAVYLANIHARFDDKKKSQYYKSFINN